MTWIVSKLTNHWPYLIFAFFSVFVLVYAYSCQSTCKSILNPQTTVQRDELQAEVDYLLDIAKARFKNLDRQDAYKKAFLDQFVLTDHAGNPNPAGLVSLIFGGLGITALINNAKLRTKIANRSTGPKIGTDKTSPPN